MITPAVGVVVPARDEETLIASCLEHLGAAAAATFGHGVHVVVVADACSDATAEVARKVGKGWPGGASPAHLDVIEAPLANVGAARSLGAALLLATPGCSWLATTDADSEVPGHWLAHQLALHALGADAWLGTVTWAPPLPPAPHGVLDDLSGDAVHPYVHGANLGVSTAAYQRLGGFAPLRTGEDVDLAGRLLAGGYRVIRGRHAAVRTSARTAGRAPAGFAADRAAGQPWPAVAVER